MIWVRTNVSIYKSADGEEWYVSIAEDVTERRATHDRLVKTECLFRALIENGMDVILLLDREGELQYASPSIHRLLGYGAADLRGRRVWELVHPEDVAPLLEKFATVRDKYGATDSAEIRLRHRDGSWRVYEGIGRNLLHDPAVGAVVINSRDVTDRIRTQEQLRAALAEARIGTELKSRFLANMSHEIRTPMNAVLGMTELLLDTSLDQEQRGYVSTMRSSAEALLTIINDILDMSKIEAGKLQLESASVDIRKLLTDTIHLFRPQAESKGLQLRSRVAGEAACTISGDPVRLRQVLTNLVGNAMKFTESGHVDISAHYDRSAARLSIQVRDTGIGIPEEMRGRVFESFVQADSFARRRFGGTGLGLAISRELVELMGGEISCESQAGAGSTFAFWVPAHMCCEVTTGASVAAAEIVPNGSRCRVLVAEDNDVNRRIATRILQQAGYLVVEATDGQKALTALQSERFDLVLMDVQMPDMDGYEATRTLRRLEGGLRRIPVIAITANAMAGDREKCLAAGMNDYISKPYNKKDFLDKVAVWTRAWERRAATFAVAERPEAC